MAFWPNKPRPMAALFPFFGVLCVLVSLTAAHTHNDSASPPPAGTLPPTPPGLIVAHICLQLLSWGILLPAGALLGLARSRLHAPLQLVAGLLIGFPATMLPHLGSSHPYRENAHASLGGLVTCVLMAQIVSGVLLKSNLVQKSYLKVGLRQLHGLVGKIFPVLGWMQIILGAIASLGFCLDSYTDNCLAHVTMGWAFVGYAIVILAIIEFGQGWSKEKKISQEYLDCWVITIWGVFNTFTEHGVFFSYGWHWNHMDMQHTSLGVVWAFAGGLGIYLSRAGRRSIVPGLIMLVTGWVFQAHVQKLPFSSKVHGAFGWTLMATGLSKACDVYRESRRTRPDVVDREADAIEHLTPLLMTTSGVMFMTATEESMLLMLRIGIDHSTYVLCQISIASLIYLYINLMKSLYRTAVAAGTKTHETLTAEGYENLPMASLSTPHTSESPLWSSGIAPKSSREVKTPELIFTSHDNNCDEVQDRNWGEDS